MKWYFSILTLGFVWATAPQAQACAVCFGASDEATKQGIVASIMFLLGLIVVVMGILTAFFVHLRKYAANPIAANAELTDFHSNDKGDSL